MGEETKKSKAAEQATCRFGEAHATATAQQPITHLLDMAGHFPSLPRPPGSSSVALGKAAWTQESGHQRRRSEGGPCGGRGRDPNYPLTSGTER